MVRPFSFEKLKIAKFSANEENYYPISIDENLNSDILSHRTAKFNLSSCAISITLSQDNSALRKELFTCFSAACGISLVWDLPVWISSLWSQRSKFSSLKLSASVRRAAFLIRCVLLVSSAIPERSKLSMKQKVEKLRKLRELKIFSRARKNWVRGLKAYFNKKIDRTKLRCKNLVKETSILIAFFRGSAASL